MAKCCIPCLLWGLVCVHCGGALGPAIYHSQALVQKDVERTPVAVQGSQGLGSAHMGRGGKNVAQAVHALEEHEDEDNVQEDVLCSPMLACLRQMDLVE